jgi:hypothetical protein
MILESRRLYSEPNHNQGLLFCAGRRRLLRRRFRAASASFLAPMGTWSLSGKKEAPARGSQGLLLRQLLVVDEYPALTPLDNAGAWHRHLQQFRSDAPSRQGGSIWLIFS